MKKLLIVAGAALAVVLGVAGPASAHVVPSVTEAPAGSYTTFTLFVGHGCEDDSATNQLEVQIPDGIESVTPQAIPGWEATVDDGADGLVVTWAGGPLPHDQFLQFGLSVQMPDTPGETLLFPTIQTCEGGASTAWIEETPEGGEEPEHPAPAIAVTESTGDHHGGGEAEEEGHDEGAEEADGAAAAETHDEDDGGDSNALAGVALAVGALGLLVGAYAVISARRAS
jgi:uncharacterized protein YcnI